jgi:hypothetical protein
MPKNDKPLKNQELTENPENDLACFLALLAEKDADLALVVERWPGLPENIKAAIKALVQTHSTEKA